MKSVKNLIVPFIILIALVIGMIIYVIVEKVGNKVPEETYGGLINVVYFNPADISTLSVYNRDTGHTSVVKCSLDSDGIVFFEYQGDDAVASEKYSQNGLSNYVDLLTSFSCNSKVSGNGNYSEYGLDHPTFTITIRALDGTDTTVFLGDKSPDGKYCYMYVAGSEDIYSVAVIKLEQAGLTAINFLDTKVLDISYSDLKTVHFERKSDGLSLDANVVITNSGIANFQFYEPYDHPASPYFGTMMDRITSLEIAEYVDIEEQDLVKYGLDDPEYHFILTMNDGSATELFLGRKVNGFYYGYVKGMDNCFKLSDMQIEGLELQETVLIDPYVCYCYVKDVSSITCKYGDREFKLTLDVPEGSVITAEAATVELDGRNAKISDSTGRSYCSILFESIACIKIGGTDINAVIDTSSGPVISFSFVDKTYNTTLYEFYTRDSDSYYVYKNGEYMSFYVYSRELFNNGGSDTYSYGCWSAYELLSEAISGNINGIYDIPVEE